MEKHEVGARTLWVFLSCSFEPRHLYDIVYGVHVLRSRGVLDENIWVFVDHLVPEPFLHPFGIENIYRISEFRERLSAAGSFENVCAIATGHGDLTGLGGGSAVLTPVQVYAGLRAVPGSTLAIIVLAQCFAGIFNYVDAAQKPPMVLIGSTNLNVSISAPLTLRTPILDNKGSVGLVAWQANLFAFNFFEWLRSPRDIDGDQDVNLLDAYKFAGVISNQQLSRVKAALFTEAEAEARALDVLKKSGADALAVQSTALTLQRKLELLYTHQEPWILHTHLARNVHFSGFTRPPSP